MTLVTRIPAPGDVLSGSSADFYDPAQPALLDRWMRMADWMETRAVAGFDPHARHRTGPIGSEVRGADRLGRPMTGINFASCDALGLSAHPGVRSGVIKAATRYGPHGGGPASGMGLTEPVVELETRLANFLGTRDATVFQSGFTAVLSAVRTVVRETDHIVIDAMASPALQEAAEAATARVHTVPHLSNRSVLRRVLKTRAQAPGSGVLVMTESLFEGDSEAPDLLALADICRRYGATLLLDVSHDIGAIGPAGRGVMELQSVLGEIDIVTGSLARTFAANAGFVAGNHPALKPALRLTAVCSTSCAAVSPLSAGAALAALDIVEAGEGARRRAALIQNVLTLRERLTDCGFHLLGGPSPVVPVALGDAATARRMTAQVLRQGAQVILAEPPAATRRGCHWRLNVMSEHTEAQIDRFIEIACGARRMQLRTTLAPRAEEAPLV